MSRSLLMTQRMEDAIVDEEDAYKYRWIAEHLEKKVKAEDALEEDFGGISDWDARDSSDEEDGETIASDKDTVMGDCDDETEDYAIKDENISIEDLDDAMDEEEMENLSMFENLYALPRHTTFLADQDELVQRVLQACPADQREDLEDHIRSSALPSTANLSMAFENFCQKESSLTGHRTEHLVRPSGSLDCPLALKLHYPTFTSQRINWGETADETSPCTKLIMEKGLKATSSMWYEAYFRRQRAPKPRRPSPMALWSAEQRKLHEDFSRWCDENTRSKVLIVFGAENRNTYLKSGIVSATFNIQVDDSTVQASIIRRKQDIDQIVIYCPHPEWLFHVYSTQAGRRYDMCINVAAALAGVQGVDPDFYERRAEHYGATGLDLFDGLRPKKDRDPKSKQKTKKDRDPELKQKTKKDRDPELEQKTKKDRDPEHKQKTKKDRDPELEQKTKKDRDPEPEQKTKKDRDPEPKQKKFGILRDVLALKARERETLRSTTYDDLPESVLSWMDATLGGSSKAVAVTFATKQRSIVDGLLEHWSGLSGQLRLDRSIQAIQATADMARLSNTNLLRSTLRVDPSRLIQVFCNTCRSEASKRIDPHPEFGTMDPIRDYYIVRTSTICSTVTCCPPLPGAEHRQSQKTRRKEIWLIPVDASVRYILSCRLNTEWEKLKPGKS